jgi:hypothetical protein
MESGLGVLPQSLDGRLMGTVDILLNRMQDKWRNLTTLSVRKNEHSNLRMYAMLAMGLFVLVIL